MIKDYNGLVHLAITPKISLVIHHKNVCIMFRFLLFFFLQYLSTRCCKYTPGADEVLTEDAREQSTWTLLVKRRHFCWSQMKTWSEMFLSSLQILRREGATWCSRQSKPRYEHNIRLKDKRVSLWYFASQEHTARPTGGGYVRAFLYTFSVNK